MLRITHPFNGPLSRTTQVSRYQKGKTNLDFTEARDSEWQWHQLGHMQVCTRDVKRTSNLRTSKFTFEFGILTFNIRVKFALEQTWALKYLWTRRLCSLPAVDAGRFTSRLPWPPAMLLVSDYPSRPTPLVLPSVSESARFDSSHASVLVDWSVIKPAPQCSEI